MKLKQKRLQEGCLPAPPTYQPKRVIASTNIAAWIQDEPHPYGRVPPAFEGSGFLPQFSGREHISASSAALKTPGQFWG